MMSDVKRYEAVHIRYEDSNIRYGEGCEPEMVAAYDYDALRAQRDQLRQHKNDYMDAAEGTRKALLAEIEALTAERDALRKDAERYRDIVAAVVREHPHRKSGGGNAPGHGHSVPGVWDSDNGALAGTECAWCKTWNEAIAALQGGQP